MQKYNMGWKRDLPDIRDYSINTPEIKKILSQSNPLKATESGMPENIDLSEDCSPIENQEQLGSCTAQAGVGLLEYYQKRAFGIHIDASRLFLYKATRNLMEETGDTGAYLRTTMQAMVLFGMPPERYLRYDITRFDEEPSSFCYSFGQNYQTIQYYRLDPPGMDLNDLLKTIKQFLAAGLPSMFGFSVYSSLADGPDIPYPQPGEYQRGGHAVVAIGYDDSRQIGNCKGALMIRNSWGEEWGEFGYGWLPYDYVLKGLAVDFWSLVEAEYVPSALFA